MRAPKDGSLITATLAKSGVLNAESLAMEALRVMDK